MVFEITEEHEELRRTVRRFLESSSPESGVRRDMESALGYDQGSWTRATEQLGLAGLAVPEQYGGLGYGPQELCLVLAEAGRALWCAPLLSTAVLATQALLTADDAEACARWLPELATGRLLATLALGRSEIRAAATADRWVLNGAHAVVVDGASAALLLVAAETVDGPTLFAVRAEDAGVIAESRLTVDLTRRLARVVLVDAPAVAVGAVGRATDILEGVIDRAGIALAVESVGAASRLLEIAVQYAKERVQFGRPIGSFQAVKHTLVDVYVDLELSRSVAWAAVDAWSSANPDLPVQASLARSFCLDAAVSAATRCTQVFGGIGFTWEHPAHLYLKRLKGSALLLGPPSEHRAVLGDRLGLRSMEDAR